MRQSGSVERKWMDRALELAERGRYSVSPNPMVGAVLVRSGRLVAEGFHERAGRPHAEVEALARAGARARGADLYVTLEPCVHFGRTLPCAPAILRSGVRRVIVGWRDPNPLVAGRGLADLSRQGVEVIEAEPDQRARAERQNEKFRVWIRDGRPFVLAKWAQTLDGRIAAAGGESRWITGRAARQRALLLREEHDAVLVGAGTILADDPRLTRRLGRNRATPHRRIVLDGRLRVSEKARVFRPPGGAVLVTSRPPRHPGVRRFLERGIEVWSLPGRNGRISVARLLSRLAREGVSSLLVEGGGETLWEFLRARRVDRVTVFLAPRILGGDGAPAAVAGKGFSLAATPRLQDLELERIGRDVVVTARVVRG